MAISMHSHSGEFCPGHAKNTLEEIILRAISRGMTSFALTEHMPRDADEDLYPEEIEAGHRISDLLPRHQSYVTEALRLRRKYASQIDILIGFESEYIRPSSAHMINTLAADPVIDFWVGSVHHVDGVPIDFDRAFYLKALEKASGREEKLWEEFFDAQMAVLRLKPSVVGHFDLIRLFSENQGGDGWSQREWNGVWERVLRNLRFIVEKGMLLEVNSAGLRKGLGEPYPGRQVCEEYLRMGGKLTLSDDSHGVDQVGTNYEKTLVFLERLGVTELWLPPRQGEAGQEASPRSLTLSSVQEALR